MHPGLRAAIDRLDRCLAAERALLLVIGREAPSPASVDDSSRSELRRAFAVVLDDLANALRAFGDLINAEYGRRLDDVDELLTRTLNRLLILPRGAPSHAADLCGLVTAM